MLQYPHYLLSPLLGSLQYVHVSFMREDSIHPGWAETSCLWSLGILRKMGVEIRLLPFLQSLCWDWPVLADGYFMRWLTNSDCSLLGKYSYHQNHSPENCILRSLIWEANARISQGNRQSSPPGCPKRNGGRVCLLGAYCLGQCPQHITPPCNFGSFL